MQRRRVNRNFHLVVVKSAMLVEAAGVNAESASRAWTPYLRGSCRAHAVHRNPRIARRLHGISIEVKHSTCVYESSQMPIPMHATNNAPGTWSFERATPHNLRMSDLTAAYTQVSLFDCVWGNSHTSMSCIAALLCGPRAGGSLWAAKSMLAMRLYCQAITTDRQPLCFLAFHRSLTVTWRKHRTIWNAIHSSLCEVPMI